jgi:predicted LPLAT superfamily acyltransferase
VTVATPGAAPPAWQQQAERGTHRGVRLMIATARLLGRRLSQIILLIVALYFLLRGGPVRAASTDYLRRVLGRAPTWSERLRHLHTFAACALDRAFLLLDSGGLQLAWHADARTRDVESEHGCLVIMSHIGSFEALRVPTARQVRLPIRIVMDRRHNAAVTDLLESLDPDLASRVIDVSDGGPALVLAMREALARGEVVGLMGDRMRAAERGVTVRFLGDRAQLPISPWALASVLGCPVYLGFGLYLGGGRYECHLERFAERIELPRERREEALQACAQRYADRMEHHLRTVPYNWFNWYSYWMPSNVDEPRT